MKSDKYKMIYKLGGQCTSGKKYPKEKIVWN